MYSVFCILNSSPISHLPSPGSGSPFSLPSSAVHTHNQKSLPFRAPVCALLWLAKGVRIRTYSYFSSGQHRCMLGVLGQEDIVTNKTLGNGLFTAVHGRSPQSYFDPFCFLESWMLGWDVGWGMWDGMSHQSHQTTTHRQPSALSPQIIHRDRTHKNYRVCIDLCCAVGCAHSFVWTRSTGFRNQWWRSEWTSFRRYAVDLVEITTWRLGASGLWGVGETDDPNSIFCLKARKGEVLACTGTRHAGVNFT